MALILDGISGKGAHVSIMGIIIMVLVAPQWTPCSSHSGNFLVRPLVVLLRGGPDIKFAGYPDIRYSFK